MLKATLEPTPDQTFEVIGEGPYDFEKVLSQTRRMERAGNVEGAFAVRHPERLAGRHLLLVDDVMTTGATLLSCADEILRSVPDCRISLAALAVSQRELGVRN